MYVEESNKDIETYNYMQVARWQWKINRMVIDKVLIKYQKRSKLRKKCRWKNNAFQRTNHNTSVSKNKWYYVEMRNLRCSLKVNEWIQSS